MIACAPEKTALRQAKVVVLAEDSNLLGHWIVQLKNHFEVHWFQGEILAEELKYCDQADFVLGRLQQLRIVLARSEPLEAAQPFLSLALVTEEETHAGIELPDEVEDSVLMRGSADALIRNLHKRWRHWSKLKSLDHDLGERDRMVQSLVRVASDYVIQLDLTGNVLWMSYPTQKALGVGSLDEIRGQNWHSYLCGNQWSLMSERLIESVLQGSGAKFTTQVRSKTGQKYWWDISISRFLCKEHEGNTVVWMARDVTSFRDQLETLSRSDHRWREMAHAVPHLVWSCQSNGKFDSVNERWQQLTHRPMEEHLGFKWREFLHPEDVDVVRNTWRHVMNSGRDFSMEFRLRSGTGDYRWFKCSAHPVRDRYGRILRWYGSNTDIDDQKRVESMLRNRESKLNAIFEQAGAGIVQMDAQGNYLLVNDAYCQITGYQRAELLSMNMKDTSHPEDLETMFQYFSDLFRGGFPFVIEKRYIRPDFTSIWVRKSIVMQLGVEGAADVALAIVQDITESREAEDELLQREAQLRLVTNNAPVMLAQFDTELRYKFVNDAYANFYALKAEDFDQKVLGWTQDREVFVRETPHMDAVFSGQHLDFEYVLNAAGAADIWYNVVVVPEFDTEHGEKVVGALMTIMDITTRKQTEQELKTARDRAVEASRAKDDFLARLSHELRTPLSPALLLASESAQNLTYSEEIRADFETIRKHVEFEARLIDDLLDLTRIARGKIRLEQESVLIHQLILDAVRSIEAEVFQHFAEVDLQLTVSDCRIFGDPVRIQQVLWNLLKNAVKFSPEGSRLILRSWLTDETYYLEIEDQGIGLDEEEIAIIFDAFAQGNHVKESNRYRYGGLGLGLAISRMLVEMHDGKISVYSKGLNQGATFRVQLPIQMCTVALNEAPPLPTLGQSTVGSLSILLVEDHDPTRTAMTKLLRRRNHQVVAVPSVNSALQEFRVGMFDLLISDIGLPDGNGYELISQLRKIEEIPAIALTGYGRDRDIERSREVGFFTHLTKPVRVQVLEAAITEATSKSKPV